MAWRPLLYCFILPIRQLCQFDRKEVLLKPTTGRAVNAKCTVCGLKYKRSYILLNTSFANRAVENSIKSRRFAFIGAREGYQRAYD